MADKDNNMASPEGADLSWDDIKEMGLDLIDDSEVESEEEVNL